LKFGERIGRLEEGRFEPNWILGKNRDLRNVTKLVLKDEKDLHRYFSGFETGSDSRDSTDFAPMGEKVAVGSAGHANLVQIAYRERFLGLERTKNDRVTNSVPKEWRRK
jgi:hypothetical protein